jgi:hypothetical protein
LTDDGNEEGDFFPFLNPNPRKGRAASVLMGKATDHFAGLASCAAFGKDGDGAHRNNLLVSFFRENEIINLYITIFLLFVKLFLMILKIFFEYFIFLFTIMNTNVSIILSLP